MKKIRYVIVAIAALFSTFSLVAQTSISSFEIGLTAGTQFVDEWEGSPFNNGRCVNATVEVVDNPYQDEMNESAKVLHYVRPYYAGDRNGVEIVLENSFNLATTTQYLHMLVHKPVSSRLVMAAIDKANNVQQVLTISSSESRPNAWSDAIFAVKGNGYEIDRIRIFPDCETAVNRLTGDIDIYIDEIEVNNSSVPRTATGYCNVKGSLSAERYISSIATTGALMNASEVFAAKAEKITNRIATTGIVAEVGERFTLNFAQKSTGTGNTPWVADVFVDCNNDKEYVSVNEYIGRAIGVADGDSVRYSIEVNIPATATIGVGSLRIKLTDAADAAIAANAYSSCAQVVDGVVYDIAMDIQNSNEKPLIKLEALSTQSGWGVIGFNGYTGTELKAVSGTRITARAQAKAGHTFVAWYNKETGSPISDDATYTFAATTNITLVAHFAEIAYCAPEGTTPTYFLGKAAITTGAQAPLYYFGSATDEVNSVSGNYVQSSIMGGVNIKRGTQFVLAVQKATASASLTATQLGMWVDWNGDHEFSADEFVGALPGEDLKTFVGMVPATAPKGNTRARLRIVTGTIQAADACANVGDGMTYDFEMTIAPNDNERFSLSAVPSIDGAATFTLSPQPGVDGKYAAGTNVEITAVPAQGYQFVQWKKDGAPYGATMTSNNPLPVTALTEDLVLTMAVEAVFPTYCAGTAPNNGDGDHYGILSGSVGVNGDQAFTFAKGSTAITDLSSTCIVDVCPGDTLKIAVSGGFHTEWSQGIAYIDWNMDGTWSETTEAYELFNNNVSGGVQNHVTRIIVPESVKVGTCGIRLCSGEAPAYNNLGGGPCKARKRGTLFTFRMNVSPLPVSSATRVRVSCDETMGSVAIHGTTEKVYEAIEGEVVTVEATANTGYQFAAWTTRAGAILSYNAVYSFAVNQAYDIVALFTSDNLTYCSGVAASGSSTFFLHSVSITSPLGSVSASTSASLNDFTTSKILEVRNGDVLTINYSSNNDQTQWGNVVIFADWNRDGAFTGTGEKYDIYGGADGRGQAGTAYTTTKSYEITVPMTAFAGNSAIRIISDEALMHNAVNNFDPCGARHKGSVHTFGLRIIDPTVDVEQATINTQVSFYPNPVESHINVVADMGATIELMQLDGRLVQRTTSTESVSIIDVARLEKGAYLVRVISNDKVNTSVFTKK